MIRRVGVGRDLRLKVMRMKPQALWTEIWKDSLRVAHSVLGDETSRHTESSRSHRPWSPSWAEDKPQRHLWRANTGDGGAWGCYRTSKQLVENSVLWLKSGRGTPRTKVPSSWHQKETEKCSRSMAHPVGPSHKPSSAPRPTQGSLGSQAHVLSASVLPVNIQWKLH